MLLVPTRDRTIAVSSMDYRYPTNQQVVIDANSRLVVAVGLPLPSSNRNDCLPMLGVARLHNLVLN